MNNRDKLYKDLENYARPEPPQKFRALAPAKSRKIPVNFLILLALGGFFYYLWQDHSLSYDPNDPHNKTAPSFVVRLRNAVFQNDFTKKYFAGLLHEDPSEVLMPGGGDTTNLSAPGSAPNRGVASTRLNPEDPNYTPTQEELDDGRWVQISGKYFRYNSDHIYVVNGVRTYYVSNRKRIVKPTTASAQSTQPATQNR